MQQGQDLDASAVPVLPFAEAYLQRLDLRYAAQPKGAQRKHEEKKPLNPYRNEYQRDRDRILYSKAFRNLAHKTQVLPFPHSSFIRTRLTHTLEVAQIARTIARRLQLNEDLTEAIALGHDLGHAPFGHVGEDLLRELLIESGGFEHNEYSLRVVEEIEELPDKPGQWGLNLTDHTRDGILKHTIARDGVLKEIFPEDKTNAYLKAKARKSRERYLKNNPLLKPFLYDNEGNLSLQSMTLEGQVVDIADEIAYITHDVEDVREALKLSEADLIKHIYEYIDLSKGLNRSAALNTLIDGVIAETERQLGSLEHDYDALEKVIIHHPPHLEPSVAHVKTFFKEQIYDHPKLKHRAREAQSYIKKLWKQWSEPGSEISPQLLRLYPRHAQLIDQAKGLDSRRGAVCYLIASLTDLEVMDCHNAIFSPTFPLGI